MNVSHSTARRFIAGEEQATCEVYEAYRKLLYFVIGTIVGNEEDTKDVFQETFAKILVSRAKIKEPKNLQSFLLTSARNCAIDFVRKRDALVDYSCLLDIYGEEDRDNAVVQELLSGLTNLEATIVIYKVEWGFSFQEIASFTGLSRQTVSSHYQQAMRELRKRYSQNVH